MPQPPPSTRLRFDRVYRSFGRLRVLRGVSGAVEAGEALLVTGSNGSGKSTLLRCLAGLMVPQEGTIECRVGGELLEIAERRRAVGYVAPEVDFYRELSTVENLDEPGRRDVVGLLGRHLETGLAVVANPERLESLDVAEHLDLDG